MQREMAQSESTIVKFIVVQRVYSSEEPLELDGQLWTRLFEATHIAVMDDVLPKITTETQAYR